MFFDADIYLFNKELIMEFLLFVYRAKIYKINIELTC